MFANQLSRSGALIISGLARGIDGAAHRAASNASSQYLTVAICGTGLDIVYPQEHQKLAAAIQPTWSINERAGAWCRA
jgi:DNA processing protein